MTLEKQPWWQYYYELYQYQLLPGRKPTVFGPYLLLQTLGEGEFGKVKFAVDIKTGQEVAIKLIKKDNIDTTSRMAKIEREISVLKILHHPNIVELYNVIETEKYIGIILQCATGGELFDYILAHRYLKEKDASRIFAQLMSGVHYMHQHHIVHRDLKLENLLLDRHRNVLITDFGFANQFTNNDLMSTSCGSPCYAAPELVMNAGFYVGPAVDIWSCGVILFAMLCGYLPYDDDPANPESYNINLLYKYILNTPLVFPDYISPEACDLMQLMLVPDPEKRATMETVMAHPWLTSHQHIFAFLNDQVVPETATETNPVENKYHASHDSEPVHTPAMEDIPPITIQSPKDAPLKPSLESLPSIVEPLPTLLESITEPPLEKPTITSSSFKETTTNQPEQINTNNTEINTESSTSHPTSNSLHEDTACMKSTTDDEENEPLSPLPTIKTTKDRPRSTSAEKMLSFLSPARVRHEDSILHSKFLTSQQKPAPSSTSASTPLKKTSPTPRPSTAPAGRRKTLSLLMDPFAQRRQSPPEPSVSEHKKSAGKKLMDWFKKKPSSTLHRSGDDVKLRTHHGAVDQEALTSRLPADVMNDIKEALQLLGLEYKRDGTEYKLKCVRPKRIPVTQHKRRLIPPPSPPLQTIYGDPNVDPGDEVRFSVELCKIKNLPGLYIIDMRRLRGNVWSYKFIYRTLLDTLKT